MGSVSRVNSKKAIRIIIPVIIVCMIAGIWIFKNHGAVWFSGNAATSGSTDTSGNAVLPSDVAMEIMVFGAGCDKCKTLEIYVTEVVDEMDMNITVTKVMHVDKYLEYGIVMTPGLVVNGKMKSFGKVPSKGEIKQFILDEM